MENISLEQIAHWVNAPIFHIGQTPVTLGGIGSGFLVFFFAFIVSAFVQRAISESLTRKLRLDSGMTYALRRILHYTIIFLGVLLAAQCVGFNLGSLAVIFGFLSVGIGFGLQNITSNFISGLIILLERPISVGAFVRVEDQVGTVVDIKMRSTVIRTPDHVSIIVPNSKFIESQVTNWSHTDPRVRLRCPIGVAYGSDIATVKKCLLEVAKSEEDVLDSPEPEVWFKEFGNSSLDFELLVWTNKPHAQFKLRSQINYKIDQAFRDAGVTIPFPQRDLHLQMTPAIEKITTLKGS